MFPQRMELLSGSPHGDFRQNPGGQKLRAKFHRSFPHACIITNHGIFPRCWSLSENVSVLCLCPASQSQGTKAHLFSSLTSLSSVTVQQWGISTSRNNVHLSGAPYRKVVCHGLIFLKEMLQYQNKANQELTDKTLLCEEENIDAEDRSNIPTKNHTFLCCLKQ